MKKLLLLLSILIIGFITLDAQTVVIEASYYQWKIGNNFSYSPWWSELENCNILIFIRTDDNIVKINNERNDKFFVYKWNNKITGRDEDGNTWSEFLLYCFDKDGNKCILSYKTWDNYNMVYFSIYYSNLIYWYLGEVVK